MLLLAVLSGLFGMHGLTTHTAMQLDAMAPAAMSMAVNAPVASAMRTPAGSAGAPHALGDVGSHHGADTACVVVLTGSILLLLALTRGRRPGWVAPLAALPAWSRTRIPRAPPPAAPLSRLCILRT